MEMLKDKNGKASSKRRAGVTSFVVGLVMGILSGFPWYNPDSAIILYILAAGATVLGLTIGESKK